MTTIKAKDGEIIVKGTKDQVLWISGSNKEKIKRLTMMLFHPPAIQGNYHPRPYSMLAALSCIDNIYYLENIGQPVPVTVDGELPEIPRPGGPDAIY